jgi:hypothetical protein
LLYVVFILHFTPSPLSIIYYLTFAVVEHPFTVKITATEFAVVLFSRGELHNSFAVELEVVERAEVGVIVGVSDLYITDEMALYPLALNLLAVWQHQ